MNEIFEKQNLAIMQNYAHYEKQIKELEAERDEYRRQILEAMQKNDIKAFENEFISITLVSGSTSFTIDTKRLRATDPDLYEDLLCTYKKITERKESLRIKVKNND